MLAFDWRHYVIWLMDSICSDKLVLHVYGLLELFLFQGVGAWVFYDLYGRVKIFDKHFAFRFKFNV